jgi:Uma2 family endonuclease
MMSTAMAPSATAAAPPTVPIPSAPMPELYRLSVAQYHEMARQEILKSGDPIELIEGMLVRKMTVNLPHIYATHYLVKRLGRMLPSGFEVYIQSPITTTDSEPEPDIAVVQGDLRQYLVQNRKPGPADTEFLIEVSDLSLAFDRTTKLRLYAKAQIQQYWIVDVIGHRVAVHSGPTGPSNAPAYQHRQEFVPGQEIPVMLDGLEVGRVKVAELFL